MGDRESHKVIPRYVVVAGVALLLGLTVLAIVFAVQDHEGRVLAEDLDRTGVELKVFGGQISDIKDADLVSMNDYISAYAQVDHLQSDYDQKLQKYNELYSLARKRDSDRGIFNVERFHGKHHPETWENMTEIIAMRWHRSRSRAGEILARAIRTPRGRGARAAREAAGHRTGNAARRKSSIGSQEVPLKSQAAPRRSFFLQTVSLSLR